MASLAQEIQQIEEIVVGSIRGSLSAAADIKRVSPVIQDSISSEDLGKFPDSNVAESLQRIPGVSIDRNGGEGRFITVRGFGPKFNTVLLNGRTFASDNVGREFSFDLLAAELISGADVYKSAASNRQDGGIGATIDIRTPRPLDINAFKGILSAKGLYEDLSEDTTLQPFGLYSDVFADGTIGVLAAVSYQERDSLINFTQNSGYLPNSTIGPPNNPIATGVFAPRNQNVGRDDQHRERLGINVTGQYRPINSLTLTLDGLYNTFDVDSQSHALGSFFEPALYTAATIDANRTVTSLTTFGNGDFIASSNNRYVTTRGVGFNAELLASDSLLVTADLSWSEAANDAGGRNYFTVIGVPSQYSFSQAGGNGFPSVINYTSDLSDPTLGRTHFAARSGTDQEDSVLETKLDLEWEARGDVLKVVRAGLVNTDRNREARFLQTDNNTLCLYCGYSTPVPSSLLSPFSLGGNFLSGGGTVPSVFQQYDPEAYFAFLESPQAIAARAAVLGVPPEAIAFQLASTNGYAATQQASSFDVDERVYGAHVGADFEGTVGGLPWLLNVGVRYVRTEVEAAGLQLQLLDILPVPGDPTIFAPVLGNGGMPQATLIESDYDDVLPSLNLRLNFTDQLIGRFAASRTLARPQIQDLAPSTNVDSFRPASLTANGGNPNLKPYQSDNFDVSLEWYPSRTTTLAGAIFYKKVDDFIVQTRANEQFTIANAGNLPVAGPITGPNQATFSVRRPRNQQSADVQGIELNLTHSFNYLPGLLSGFGTQLNTTFVDSNAEFSTGSTNTSFALEGLSDSQNVTVFYEEGKFSARLAYNRRERFLEFLVTPGEGGDPVFRRTFEQFDLRLGYSILNSTQLFLEGINIFSEENVTTGRFDNQLLEYIDTGSRWALGLRATF